MATTLTERAPAPTKKRDFAALLNQLSKQSVEKHHDAYADIDWDGQPIDPTDARFRLPAFDALAQTDWYRSQAPDVQARIGLHRTAAMMKTGWHFENLLQRALLAYAFRLPNRSPQFRYIQHEVAEESQHTMMFQEFVDRSGLDVSGMPLWARAAAKSTIMPAQRLAPAAFFFMVIGGEDPVDHLQKQLLRSDDLHPLTERIMRIHVIEEARHLSFAREQIKRLVPGLNRFRRFELSIAVPVVLGIMTPMMIHPPAQLTRAGVPKPVLREARRSASHRQLVQDCVAKPRRLAAEVGLSNPVSRFVWRRLGLGHLGAKAAPAPA